MIGIVVLLGLAAFLSLNPYLIAIFSFSQVFMIVGIGLFVVALVTRGSESVAEENSPNKAAASIDDSEDRAYVLGNGRLAGSRGTAMVSTSRLRSHLQLRRLKNP